LNSECKFQNFQILILMSHDTIIKITDASIFQKNSLVLSNVSLSIDKGEFVYLIGKTGAGKSSLLKTLYSELPLVEGEIEVAGYNIKHIKAKEIPYLRRKLGIVFQDFQLLNDRSVNDNLLFVMKATGWKDDDAMRHRMNEVLDKVGLITKGFKMPHQLSGGEQQRVCIARALINDPELILADEPTGNLDPETSEGIIQLLLDISNAGRAVFMATHNFSLIRKFPFRTVKCENGKVMEVVSPSNIILEE
jgi:cell division transport system ATP-binding protein